MFTVQNFYTTWSLQVNNPHLNGESVFDLIFYNSNIIKHEFAVILQVNIKTYLKAIKKCDNWSWRLSGVQGRQKTVLGGVWVAAGQGFSRCKSRINTPLPRKDSLPTSALHCTPPSQQKHSGSFLWLQFSSFSWREENKNEANFELGYVR